MARTGTAQSGMAGTDKERWAHALDEIAAIIARLIALSEAETSSIEASHYEWVIHDLQRLARSYTDRLEAHAELRRQLEDSLK